MSETLDGSISDKVWDDRTDQLSEDATVVDINDDHTAEEIIDNFTEYDCLIGNEVFWKDSFGIAKSIALDGSLVVESNKKELNLYSEEVHLERN